MGNWRLQFARVLGLCLLAGLAGDAWALPKPGQATENRREPQRDKERGARRNVGPRGMRRALDLPPRWIERLRQMSPEEQERFLQNNERFRNLPPERQEQIRRRLQQWNTLSPEQQRAVREREDVWRQMTPEQHQRIREEILPRWQKPSPERRRAILRRMHALHELSAGERTARLQDENFLSGLNSEERELLRELANLRLPPPEQNEPQEPQSN